jgi:uncharacterized phage infection (PIP) family protein YhgE
VIKWCYFGLLAAFLAAVLWMINDMRMGVNRLLDQVEQKLPPMLKNTEQLVARLDQQLPPLLKNSEQAAKKINTQLPRILKNTEQAAKDINTHLPKLLAKAQQGVDELAGMGKSFKKFSELFGSLDAPRGDRDGVRVASKLPSQIEAPTP